MFDELETLYNFFFSFYQNKIKQKMSYIEREWIRRITICPTKKLRVYWHNLSNLLIGPMIGLISS